MELNWLECLIFGLVSGLTEFLPISAVAHQTVLGKLLGWSVPACLRFSALLGSLAAVILACAPMLRRLNREWRIQSIPKKRRRRQPDFATVMEMRVFRTGVLMVLAASVGYGTFSGLSQRLWLLAILLGLNGLILYLPQFMPGANKTAQSLSRLDAVLIGLAAGCGFVPGLSSTGFAISVARMRGADRKYAAELSLLLSIPVLVVSVIVATFALFTAGVSLTGLLLLFSITAGAAAFAGAYWGIVLIRFLAVRVGYAGFGYYCWGLALFTLILYLI